MEKHSYTGKTKEEAINAATIELQETEENLIGALIGATTFGTTGGTTFGTTGTGTTFGTTGGMNFGATRGTVRGGAIITGLALN